MIRGFEQLEQFVYRRADKLAVISEGFRRHLLARGVPDQKIAVIPNYTDTDLIQPQDHSGFRRELGLDDRFVVQFSGRMGYSQGLETVVEAFELLNDLDDLHLMLVGDGQAKANLEKALAGHPRVSILPTQPRDRLSDLLAAADVGLAPLRRGMAGTSVPSKIFGIMASGRPVVAAVDPGSDTDELVATAEAGLVVPPEDPRALADALRALHADRERARRLGRNAREYVERHHSPQVTVDRYERLLQDVVGR
jgi:colanic acid biosynthesis glycosyl transferase WcaI